MRLEILGCSGGIAAGMRTTAMLLDGDVLIDAGTGVGDLGIAEMARIDHVFVSHSHLDHVCSIPFMSDTVGHLRSVPLTVHGIAETIAALRAHLFNGVLWPDFSRLPRPQAPYLRYHAIRPGEPVHLGARKITAVPASHAVPAVGYWLDSGAASLVYTGDTGPNDALWDVVNAIANLRYLVIETSFRNGDRGIAAASRHLCPSLLAAELDKLRRPAEIFITHLKPGDRDATMKEVKAAAKRHRPKALEQGQVFEF